MTFEELKRAVEYKPPIVWQPGERLGVRIADQLIELTVINVTVENKDGMFLTRYDGVPDRDGVPREHIFGFTDNNIEYKIDADGKRIHVSHHVSEDLPNPYECRQEGRMTDQEILKAINDRTEEEEND